MTAHEDEREQASDERITRPTDAEDEAQTERESAMGDPREEPGTPPEWPPSRSRGPTPG
jgi:hypothetical protein